MIFALIVQFVIRIIINYFELAGYFGHVGIDEKYQTLKISLFFVDVSKEKEKRRNTQS